jgi:hypothetical protein
MRTGGFSVAVKRPGREADHSPPFSAEVKECVELPPFPNTPSWGGTQFKKSTGTTLIDQRLTLYAVEKVYSPPFSRPELSSDPILLEVNMVTLRDMDLFSRNVVPNLKFHVLVVIVNSECELNQIPSAKYRSFAGLSCIETRF